MTKTINDVYMQLFRRLKEGGDPMPQLTAREITAYACKADKKQTAGWSHFYVEDTTVVTPVCCATAVWTASRWRTLSANGIFTA